MDNNNDNSNNYNNNNVSEHVDHTEHIKCIKCERILNRTDFWESNLQRSICICKECAKKINKEQYKRNSNARKRRAKQYRLENKDKVDAYEANRKNDPNRQEYLKQYKQSRQQNKQQNREQSKQ